MRNVLDKICTENRNTHFMFNNFLPKIVPFMTTWKNMLAPETTEKMAQHNAHLISKATHTKAQAQTVTHAPTHTHTHTHRNMKYLLFFHSNNG
jgi:hypothetical protein